MPRDQGKVAGTVREPEEPRSGLETSEERTARIKKLKEQVRNGTYAMDARELALILLEDDRQPLH